MVVSLASYAYPCKAPRLKGREISASRFSKLSSKLVHRLRQLQILYTLCWLRVQLCLPLDFCWLDIFYPSSDSSTIGFYQLILKTRTGREQLILYSQEALMA